MLKTKKLTHKFFFGIYMIIISFLLIGQLLNCGTEIYEPVLFGTSADAKCKILDKNLYESVFRINADNPDGFMIFDFQKDTNLDTTDARIYIEFYDESTHILIQQTEINPSEETSDIYIKFRQALKSGTKVRMRLWSKGFVTSGPTFSISKKSANGSALWRNGELVNKVIYSGLYYKHITYEYLKPIIYYIGEVLIGLILLLAWKKFNLPLYIKKKNNPIRRPIKWKSLIAGCFILAVVTAGLLEYVYSFKVKPMLNQCNYQETAEIDEESTRLIALEEGDQFSQIVDVDKNNLLGLGIACGTESTKKGVLKCKIYNFLTGAIVLEKEYKISEMKKMSSYVSADTVEKETLSDYRVLALEEVLPDSELEKLNLEFTIEKTGDEKFILEVGDAEEFPLQINGEITNAVLPMAAVYSDNFYLKAMYIYMAIVLVLLLFGLYIWVCFYTVPVGKIFLISALTLGFIYCFLIPAYNVPDEGAHADAVYSVSNQLLGISEIPGPNRIYKRACDTVIVVDEIKKQYAKTYDSLFSQAEDVTLKMARSRSPISNVTVLHYLPAAIGFTIARIFHYDHYFMLLLGRLFNMLAMVYLLYIAVQKMPVAKPMAAVLGLLPMTLQQISSVSYDGIIIAAAYVFIAYACHLFWETDVSILDIAILIFAACILATSKAGVYIPLLGILLLIPYMREISKKKWLIGVMLSLGSLALIYLAQFSARILSIFGRQQATASLGGNVTDIYTIAYFIERPKAFVRILQNTFWDWGDYYLRGMLGAPLGLLNISVPWFILIGFLVLLLACTIKCPGDKDRWKGYSRIYALGLCIASVILILLSLLVTWTNTGATSVQGIQGRYFLPLTALVMLLLRSDKLVFVNKREDKMVYMATILNIFTICAVIISIF